MKESAVKREVRFWGMLLCFLFVMAGTVFGANGGFADTAALSDSSLAGGSCGADGNEVRWSLSADGLLTVQGVGRMRDYLNANSVPWFRQRYQIRFVLIEKGVSGVGNYAFSSSPNLTSLTVDGGIRTIGDYAFSNCPNLGDVLIGEGDRTLSIGLNAFNGCKALEEIALPDNVSQIGQAAFANCESLRVFHVPENVTALSPSVFGKCYALETVTLPQTLETIGQRAFSKCGSLAEITIPIRVGTLGAYAFEDCAALTEISIPARIGDVPEGLCSGCAGLKTIYFRNGLQTVQSRAFQGCATLTDIYYDGSRTRWSGLIMTEFRAQIAAQGIAVHCKDDTDDFATAISEVSVNGQRVFVTVSGEQGGETGEAIQLYTAFYDAEGRFLGARLTSTQTPESGNTRSYLAIAYDGAAGVKAMLLWPDSRPAAESVWKDMG